MRRGRVVRDGKGGQRTDDGLRIEDLTSGVVRMRAIRREDELVAERSLVGVGL